jgi:hypothetical protein
MLMAIGYGTAQPKPEPRKKAKARKLRLHRTHVHDVRDYVFKPTQAGAFDARADSA